MKRFWLLMLAVFALGCSDRTASVSDPDPAVEPSETAAAAEAPSVPDTFEFLRYASRTDTVAPEICLTFSKPLDPSADYTAFLAVEQSIVANVDGSRLCLGGLSYGETADLTLRKGLPSAAGDELPNDETLTLTFDDRPPVVAFAGDGIILPRTDADGLALTTVNVEEVSVTITRVNDRALVMRAITEGFKADAGEYWYEYGDDTPGRFGSLVWSGVVSTAGPTNGTVTTVLPFADVVGDVEPGAYYVQIRDGTPARKNERRVARAARWIISTDLALTAYRGASGTDVVVRSLQNAYPQGGVNVQLVANSNEVLADVVTDRFGRAALDAPLMNGTGGDRPKLLLAYGPQGDFAMLDLDRPPVDLSAHDVGGRARPSPVDAFSWLDRGIYRPGEAVHANTMLRDAAGRAVTDRAGALVMYKPNGIEFARQRFEDLPNAGGLSQTFDLPEAAVRGSWRLAVEIDGVGTVQSTYFSVEDFVPQRIEIDLDAPDGPPLSNADPKMVGVRAAFLYGAPGAGLTVDGTARIQRDPSPFDQWSDYRFGLFDEPFRERLIRLPAVVTDGAGNAAIPVSAGREAAGSTLPLRVRAVVEVEEPGGRTVADDVRIPYRPREAYFGIKPLFDGRAARNEAVSFDVIGVDRLGAGIAAETAWRLVRRDFEYDWYRVDGGSWQWRRSERIVPIENGVLSLPGEAPGTVNTPELTWGDYRLILSVDGEDVASTSFWVGWGGYTSSGDEAPDEVRVAQITETAQVGSDVRIAIQAPYAGKADVVVATDRVLSVEQIDLPAEGTEIDIAVDPEWGAGAYVMVTTYTPRDREAQPTPRRAVGVTYVPTDVSDRTFDVELDLPDKIEPDQTLSVPVRASASAADQTIFVTVAAVDEGILQLTKFQTPDPAAWVFGKTALGMSLYDDYGRLLDPNQGAAAPVRSGGDQIGGAGLTVVPTKTVALFSGPVDLGRNGRGRIDLDVPDFNGKLRVMAVAWSEDAVGSTDHALTVRDAVPAELILPRFLAPGDEAVATLTLDNVEGRAGEYTSTLTATGQASFPQTTYTTELDVGTRKDQPVTIAGGGVGISDVSLAVTGPGRFDVERSYPIETRSAHWPETRVTKVTLAAGESYTPDPSLLDGFVPYSGEAMVSIAATPIDTSALYTSLYGYPYACTEQLTSRMFPLLYSGSLARLAGGEGPEGAPREVRKSIETLLSRQSADGAFGLWRMGDGQASPWLGAYATDFLTRAAAAGYFVPEAALSRAMDALDPIADGNVSRSWGYNSRAPNPRWSKDTNERIAHRSSAYAAYVLARNGRGDRSRLRYMHDSLRSKIESPVALAHIGAGLAAMGDTTRATSAFATATERLGYDNPGDWYQTPRRDLAAVVALAAESGLTDVVSALTPEIVKTIPEPQRLTTQEKAFLILASKAIAGDAESVAASYSKAAADPTSVSFSETTIAEAGTFTNDGETALYVTTVAKGAPATAPAAISRDLRLTKRITDLSGRAVDLASVSQGDRMVVSLTARPGRAAYAQFMVVDLLPAGFEIEAVIRPDEAGDNGPYAYLGSLHTANLSEARDDRFVAAFDGAASNSYRFAYLVRAVTPGTFTVPGAIAEDMYAPDVFARTAAGEAVITP